jgi:hypothetical protein
VTDILKADHKENFHEASFTEKINHFPGRENYFLHRDWVLGPRMGPLPSGRPGFSLLHSALSLSAHTGIEQLLLLC